MNDSIASLKIGIMEDLLKIFNIMMEDDDTTNSQNEDTNTENKCFDGILTTLLGGIVETMCGETTSELEYSDDSQSLKSYDAPGSPGKDTILAVGAIELVEEINIQNDKTSEENSGENVLTTFPWKVDKPICENITLELGYGDGSQSLKTYDAPGSPGQGTILAVDAMNLVEETNIQNDKTSEENSGENVLTTFPWKVDEPICENITLELEYGDDSQSLKSYDAPGTPGQGTILAVDVVELVAEAVIQKENKTSDENCGENSVTIYLDEMDEEITLELECGKDNHSLQSYDAPGAPGHDTILAVVATEQAEKVNGMPGVDHGKKREEGELAKKNDPEAPPAINHKPPRGRSRRFIATTWKGVRRATRLLLCGCFRGE